MSGFPESDPGAHGLHAAWYTANRERGTVTAQRCVCGRFRVPARYRCAGCGGADWSFEPIGPGAVVETWTVTRRPVHPSFAEVVPYGIVVARTDEQVRLLLQFRGAPDTLQEGLPVRIAVDTFGVPYADPVGEA